MFRISSATRQPVVDTAMDTIEGRVWRVNRHAGCCKVEKSGLKRVRECEGGKGFEDRGVVRHDKCYRGFQRFLQNSGGQAGRRRQS